MDQLLSVVSERKPVAGAATSELMRPHLAACHCSVDKGALKQELEYLWDECASSGKTYEMYLGKISSNPIIKSKITGKFFALPWSLIINLAVEQGIDK